MATTVVITGGSGSYGRYLIRHLHELGYQCVSVDRVRARVAHPQGVEEKIIDLLDYQALSQAIDGADFMIHLAALPDPDLQGDFEGAALIFANNTTILNNAFLAAAANKVRRVVWASSETVYGYPFLTNAPSAIRVTEDSPLAPQTAYANSKILAERLAELVAEKHGVEFVGLRLSNIIYEDSSERDNYHSFPSYWDDLANRSFNLWGYIDARDAVIAAELALTKQITQPVNLNIAAPDTLMTTPTDELFARVFAGHQYDKALSTFSAVLDCGRAYDVLGWEANHQWRSVLAELFPSNEAQAKEALQ